MDNEISQDTKTMKRKERLEQNRISARESRKRKKTMIEELQRTVITLSKENKDLNDRNEGLRRELIDIGSEYPSAVPLHAVMTGDPSNSANVSAGTSTNTNFDQNTGVTSAEPSTFPSFPMFAGMGQPNGAWPAPVVNTAPAPVANVTPAPSSAQQAS